MWPDGPNDMTTQPDYAWKNVADSNGKAYMMGVSPWFYTDLPQYNKAWVWRFVFPKDLLVQKHN